MNALNKRKRLCASPWSQMPGNAERLTSTQRWLYLHIRLLEKQTKVPSLNFKFSLIKLKFKQRKWGSNSLAPQIALRSVWIQRIVMAAYLLTIRTHHTHWWAGYSSDVISVAGATEERRFLIRGNPFTRGLWLAVRSSIWMEWIRGIRADKECDDEALIQCCSLNLDL